MVPSHLGSGPPQPPITPARSATIRDVLDFGSAPKQIHEIVFTGGSCAGKTSALSLVARSLRDQGRSVLTVPEAVTMLVAAGTPDLGDISRNDLHRGCRFQRAVWGVQRAMRRNMAEVAQLFPTDHVTLLYDRGELDGLGYHAHDCIEGFAAEEGFTLDEVRASYTAVMHLVTAARGAERSYAQSGNPARWDTAEEAALIDRQIMAAWRGHPNHIVIDNSTDFIRKMDRLVAATVAVIDDAEAGGALRTMAVGGVASA